MTSSGQPRFCRCKIKDLFSKALKLKSFLLRKTPQNCGAWSSDVRATSKQQRPFQRALSKAHWTKKKRTEHVKGSTTRAQKPPELTVSCWFLMHLVAYSQEELFPQLASFGLFEKYEVRVWTNQPTLEQVPIWLAPKFQQEGMRGMLSDPLTAA